jgi:hypothetical protein
MSESSLYIYTCELIAAHRAKGTDADRFIADQLERIAQLLRFTGAETAREFAERVEANELWARDEEFNRGWRNGRASLQREISESPYRIN